MNGGTSTVNDPRGRGGGGNNKNKPQNRNNQNNKNRGGGGGGPAAPAIAPFAPLPGKGDLGLNTPGQGTISDNPFAIGSSGIVSGGAPGAGVLGSPGPFGLPGTKQPGAGGWRGGGGRTDAPVSPPWKGGLAPVANPNPADAPIFSDTNPHEIDRFANEPEAAYQAMLRQAGMSASGNDLLAQYLANDYQRLYGDYNLLRTDDANTNLTWFDYLGNLGGTPYGRPGWSDAFRRYMTGRYNAAGVAGRGEQVTPYSGFGRWLTF